MRHTVYSEIWSPEDLEAGECSEHDVELESESSLRETVKVLFETRTSRTDGCDIYANEFWISVRTGPEFETGCEECRTLPRNDITASSWRRLCNLIAI